MEAEVVRAPDGEPAARYVLHVPPNPVLVQFLGRFSPATYAASALRQALVGPLTGRILLDLGVLAGFTAVVFWLVGHKMDWRQR